MIIEECELQREIQELKDKLKTRSIQREYWRNCYYILQNKYEGTNVPIKEDYWNLTDDDA